MKKIFIIILHFINRQLTCQCLESVKKLNRKGLKTAVVVVNNNPKEDIEDIKKKFSDVVFLETGKNLGFAGGNNVGIRYALKNGADYVLILNNDTTVDKDLLVQLISAMGGSAVGIVAPKIYFAPGYEYHWKRYKTNEQGKVIWYAGGIVDWQNVLCSHRGVDEVDAGQYDKQTETDFVSGCAMLVKSEVFKKIGLLDRRYFLYLEDVEFSQRAKKAGFRIIYTPEGRLWHLNASSSEVGGELQDYFITRNRMLFGLKYAPWRAKTALIRESFKILITGRKWQKIGIRDFYLRKFGKGSWLT